MANLSTEFSRLLGIDLPIVQAPIGSASTPELAAEVSNAGGLGMLSLTWRSIAETREVIARTQELTERPFGINLVTHWDPAERLAIALEAGIRFVSFSWGDTAPWIEVAHEAGALVAVSAGTAQDARRAVDHGADVIVTQGVEAGGHLSAHVGTMALVPAAVDTVSPAPVLAAGGIADGRGVAAALCLGASGVWIGTRFLMSDEANIHDYYRQRLIDAQESDPVSTNLFRGGWPPGTPLRTLPNKSLQLWEDAGRPEQGRRPGEGDVIGQTNRGVPILRYSDDFPGAHTTGDLESMVLYAGESVGLVNRVQPAAEIVQELAAEAALTLDRLGSS